MTNKLNRLYAAFDADPSHLGTLLEAVRTTVSKRFARLVIDEQGHRGPLDSNYEDIASDTMIRIWRTLPGYPGNDKLKTYEDCGKFASFVVTTANTVRKDMSKLRDNSLVSHYDSIDLEYMCSGLEPGFEAEEPEDFYADPENRNGNENL